MGAGCTRSSPPISKTTEAQPQAQTVTQTVTQTETKVKPQQQKQMTGLVKMRLAQLKMYAYRTPQEIKDDENLDPTIKSLLINEKKKRIKHFLGLIVEIYRKTIPIKDKLKITVVIQDDVLEYFFGYEDSVDLDHVDKMFNVIYKPVVNKYFEMQKYQILKHSCTTTLQNVEEYSFSNNDFDSLDRSVTTRRIAVHVKYTLKCADLDLKMSLCDDDEDY